MCCCRLTWYLEVKVTCQTMKLNDLLIIIPMASVTFKASHEVIARA